MHSLRNTLAASLVLLLLSACRTESPEESFDPGPWIERGVAVTSTSFSVMSSRLLSKLDEGGVPAAIEYCSLAAYPMTDSLSQAYSAVIRRAALRYRNPSNAPTDRERSMFERYRTTLESGGTLQPVAERLEDGSVAFYAPIILAQPCTRCHGQVGEDIADEDYALIRERYPADSATGFAPGDLRGIWSLRFNPD